MHKRRQSDLGIFLRRVTAGIVVLANALFLRMCVLAVPRSAQYIGPGRLAVWLAGAIAEYGNAQREIEPDSRLPGNASGPATDNHRHRNTDNGGVSLCRKSRRTQRDSAHIVTCVGQNNPAPDPATKLLIASAVTILGGAALAEDVAPFRDLGANYNLLEYVETYETGDGSYTLEFRNDEESYFTVFIVSSAGVIAFDPLSDSAANIYARIIKEKAPGLPLLAIVYSHRHIDHIAGARTLRQHFGRHVPIIAHERVLSFFEERRTPFIDLPTKTVTDAGGVFRFGDRTIELHYLGDAHTATILVPEIRELQMAYVCDFASNDVVGWRDLPGINIGEIIAMQRRALELDVDAITFCHGAPGNLSAIERQLDYFETLSAVTSKAVARGLTEDEAVQRIDLPRFRHFSHYDEWFRGNVRAMHRWAKSHKLE